MNELALIFHRIGIDTLEVLEAAGTKWNFLPFRPGLVGGHCIGVDPYYLTHKAEKLGYHPQVILAGRRINDGMGKYVAEQTVKQMIQSGFSVKGAHVIVLGLTFKENCPTCATRGDRRHPRARDRTACTVHVHDPVAEAGEARARVRRRAGAVGAPAAGQRDRRRGRAPRVRATRPLDQMLAQAVDRAASTSTSSARPTRRRCARAASTSGGCDDASRACEPRCVDALRARPRRWLVTGSAGFIGSHLRRGAAAPRPAASSASTTSRPAIARNLDEVRAAVGERGVARGTASSKATSPTRDACRAACEGVDIVLHQAALGSVPRSIADPLATHAPTRPASSTCWSPRATPACARFVYAASSSTYGDSPGAAEGRGRDRPPAVAVRGDQVRRTSSTPTSSAAATAWRRSACATSTCSARARIPKARTPR